MAGDLPLPPSSAPTDEGGTDEGETAEGGADKDGPSVPTDPGTDAFEVVVDGVGHRIATVSYTHLTLPTMCQV